jgi:hypothetical protein
MSHRENLLIFFGLSLLFYKKKIKQYEVGSILIVFLFQKKKHAIPPQHM